MFAHQQKGVQKKRARLHPQEPTPEREGTEILEQQATEIRTVCSGGFGPTLPGPHAMGFMHKNYTALETLVWPVHRGKTVPKLFQKK
ncbi:glycine cleavage T C-terminal barrel domain-containing protein, partial [Pseudomonas syringae group genomosp. 7]|uniref:glycine cleavage T C-terminal barrel domain-containing protein n=1 Tax=Pseudomonas syringae group genomosp. 7 TaxID=251699 RepID=UPI00376F5B1A